MTATTTAPDIIWGKGDLKTVCEKIFSYPADYYDLQAYEAVLPGSAERIWDMVCAEAKAQGMNF